MITHLQERMPSQEEIELARLFIVENATDLRTEAEFLLKHGHFARAYLLAHLASEEIAKLAVLARVSKALQAGEPVNWNKVVRVLREHPQKLTAMILSDHSDSIDLEDGDEDADLAVKLARISELNRRKNASMYVDIEPGVLTRPRAEVREEDARAVLRSLTGRWLWAFSREAVLPEKLPYDVLDLPQFEEFWQTYDGMKAADCRGHNWRGGGTGPPPLATTHQIRDPSGFLLSSSCGGLTDS